VSQIVTGKCCVIGLLAANCLAEQMLFEALIRQGNKLLFTGTRSIPALFPKSALAA